MNRNFQNFAPTGGYNQNGGTFQNQFNGYGNNQPRPKKSGCRAGTMKDGRPWVSGWHGFGSDHCSFIANRGKDDGKVKGKGGDRWESWIANFKNNKGQTWTVNCLYDLQKRRLKFISLGWVANPSAPNGGYFGKGGTSKTVKNNNNNR